MADPFLVLAPDGRDAEVIGLVLARAGLAARLCPDVAALCEALRGDAGGLAGARPGTAGDGVTALVLSEHALADGVDGLAACLDAQPSWSDLPVLVLTARGGRIAAAGRAALFGRLGNVTLLDRPLHAEALQSAARAAARARQRQHRTRAHLEEIAAANARLEQRVAERTQALHAEMAERRRAEEALRQAQKMEAVGQLTGGIAHDFNNILQIVQGNLHALEVKLAADDRRRCHAERAQAAVRRAATLTSRLLAFARRQPLLPERVDLNALVAAMGDLLRRSLGERIRMEIDAAPDLWPVRADANQVESALLNLVLNARDAMPDGGCLRIETANVTVAANPMMANPMMAEPAPAEPAPGLDLAPGAYALLRVRDDGMGMAPEVVGRAFEPFFTTKVIGQGTGLGLSQVYGFARQSGGHATIESRPGQGTVATLYLPRHDPSGDTDADIPETAPPPSDTGPAGTAPAPAPATPPAPPPARGDAKRTVLVVEDEALVLMLWVDLLERRGFRVLQASHPDAALETLGSDTAIDLLVTDVGLPGMNGRELAGRARALRPGLKTLFITGYARHAALDGDSLDARTRLLSKPVAPDTLLHQVHALLDLN